MTSSRSRSTAPTASSILRHSTAHVLAQAVQRINPQANLGIGPPITDGFYYDFGVEEPFTPERPEGHREGDGAHRPRGTALRPSRRHRRRGARRARGRAVQARAHRAQGRQGGGRRGLGRGRRRRADDLRQRRPRRRDRLEGPLPRPARAEHPHDRQRLGPDPHRRRLLAGEREEPAAAAHLRHRLADQGRAARLPGAPRGGRQARPPQARQGARPVLVPGRDRLGPVGVAPARRHRPQEMEQHARRRHKRGRLHLRVHAAHLQAGPVPQSNHLVTYKEGMFPPIHHGRGARRARRDHQAGPGLLPQADELPDAHPDLQGACAQLPRPADASGRERHRLPQRALRRAARAHPRARLHPGRLAPVRHPRAARGARRPTCSSSSSRCCATSV